ncbi:unnamed protein product [Nesidiocoris tenuis]|uniref:Uncharacterized protein n=1 Tax=Nesidiocoris tenuis TaxID=355587 RepID=A0A6H5GXQ6_9HEMI|nr:unnamed protein product [Nesidiocoris tenuis]
MEKIKEAMKRIKEVKNENEEDEEDEADGEDEEGDEEDQGGEEDGEDEEGKESKMVKKMKSMTEKVVMGPQSLATSLSQLPRHCPVRTRDNCSLKLSTVDHVRLTTMNVLNFLRQLDLLLLRVKGRFTTTPVRPTSGEKHFNYVREVR